MKITEVVCQVLRVESVTEKTASCQDVALVRVLSDTGLEGIGEADASPEVVQAVIDAPFSHNIACGLRELLVGQDPLAIRRNWNRMYRGSMYFGRTSVTVAAMAAVDMALWDLAGKHYNAPIHQLLGGKQHDEIRAYASILFGADGTETAEIGRRWVEAGYTAVKFGWEPMGTSEAVDIDLVRGARDGLGSDATLLIDAGCVWDARTALRRAVAFSEFDVEWLEEPLHQADVDGYAWLRDRSPVPIAAGEGECGRESFRPLIDRHAHWMSTRSISPETASPIRPTCGTGSRRSGRDSAIIATPARSPSPPVPTGSRPAATRSCSRTVSRMNRCGTN